MRGKISAMSLRLVEREYCRCARVHLLEDEELLMFWKNSLSDVFLSGFESDGWRSIYPYRIR